MSEKGVALPAIAQNAGERLAGVRVTHGHHMSLGEPMNDAHDSEMCVGGSGKCAETDAARAAAVAALSEVEQLRAELAAAQARTRDAEAEAAALHQAVESAVNWQRKWFRRTFHRWKPPGQQQARMGMFRKLERSLGKRRKELATWLSKHDCAWLAEFFWSDLVPPPVKTRENFPKVRKKLAFPVVVNPKVSIIITTYGKLDITLTCLRSIAAHMPLVPIEVLVLEDCSDDAEIDQLAAISGLRYVRHRENLGFARSNNRAADLACGEYLHFLNNDTQVTSGWLDAMLEVFHTRPNCGLVGSKLVFPDGRLLEAGCIVWKDATGRIIGRGENPSNPEFNYLREVDYCAGASLLIRRNFFDKLGRFDERYAPAYFEDVDLAFKVRAAGRKLYYQPKSIVIHHEGISHGTDIKQALIVANRTKFVEKWAKTLQQKHSPPERIFKGA